jgi:hypothetical protein
MCSTLATGEDSIVDTLLEIRSFRMILPEEDQSSTGTTKRFVSSGGDDITILKGVVQLLSSNKTRGVSNIGHKPGSFFVCDLTELSILPVTGISRGTADNETGPENLSLRGKSGIINEVGIRGGGVRE